MRVDRSERAERGTRAENKRKKAGKPESVSGAKMVHVGLELELRLQRYTDIIFAGQDPAGIMAGSYGSIRNKAAQEAITHFLEVVKIDMTNPMDKTNPFRVYLKPQHFLTVLEQSLEDTGIDPCFPWRLSPATMQEHGNLAPLEIP